MKAPALELADIFRIHGPAYLDDVWRFALAEQKKALRDDRASAAPQRSAVTSNNATAVAIERSPIAPAAIAIARSARAQPARHGSSSAPPSLLPVEYFHVVFTLPQTARAPGPSEPADDLRHALFRAAAETLLQIAADPKHLGARIGFVAVLHTWGQNLHHHPHLHCVVPGGGIAPDRCTLDCLSPAVSLSREGAQPALPRQVCRLPEDELFATASSAFMASCSPLRKRPTSSPGSTRIARSEWVVYAKPPFGGPQQVLKYLARYTHRVAISNQRLVALAGRPSELSLEGLYACRPARHHDPAGDRVHSSLSTPRAAHAAL